MTSQERFTTKYYMYDYQRTDSYIAFTIFSMHVLKTDMIRNLKFP